ncbi:hypothetical protein CLAFUW4_03911 [Fulvia fulva]|uniref:BOD1/SHG1 domain-containing protein n=1 Tax=Passalora fulva TaxID=5499 RepID=A0A9Q8LBL7_PASFU|nr:uncharacterized protein CLAFUR5_03880 [Fulvia fulva]KAK4632197.1 hypothetical protein CLAFUR4_03899 [Fulvia fulva]KAK4633619.1 hypothetical protein CLAFUR0_03898 [Fulvia fulva]UJO14404.1 hypothetical protein CLAFUR5_03880 [Fulvia fulva]WPV11933.1 hypothetical protein CLAFUW4_03911 [Fulvia fulva]WPV25607.1 hypothetical protein CLAFUW7_03902 [Fulvia fulva]
MAATDTINGDWELPPRKKPKISELPLSSTQRASIDSMLHTFKKKGEFDALRKKAFQQYNESAKRGMFEASLRAFTAQEIDRDPIKYLKPDRRIAAPLLEGSAARGDVYGKTEQDVDAYIDQYMQNAEQALRGIRADEVGGELANEEYRKGLKSDDAYAEEADARRQDREVKYKEDEKKRAKREAQEQKKKELEMLKKKQEALMKETTKLQAEQKRRAEREAWKNAEKERERERIRKYNEDREAAKKKAEEKEQAEQEERERRRRERAEAEQKRLEAEALDLLLKEGQEMTDKSRRPELERSESMEPPPRLKHQSAPRNNASKDQMRAQGLMPTSLTLRKGDKPVVAPPTGPRASRPRSPSPARSTFSSSRRREPTPDDRRGSRLDTRRESSYRDVSAEREAWRSRRPDGRRDRSRSPVRRERDRGRDSRVRSPSRRRYDQYIAPPRGKSWNRERERERGEEGEVVERAARSKSRESYRDIFRDSNTYRPAGARRNASQSRSPPRRRERSRSRSPPRRRESRDRGGRRGRGRSPPGIDRYIPGGPAAAAAAAGKGKDDDEAPRKRARDEETDPKEKPRESTTRIRDERDRSPPRTRIRDERDRTPARTREGRNRSPDRRRRYDERERSNVGTDRWIPGGGGGARDGDDDRPRRRERSRPREDRYVPSHRERSRDRDAGRDRERSRDRERDRDDRDKGREERRPTAAKAEGED